MNEQNDIMCYVRESLSGLSMDVPVETVFARSRRRRRRRLSGLTATAAVSAAAATAMALTLGGPAPARSGNPPPVSRAAANTAPSVKLAAFSVTSGPGDGTTMVLRKGYRLDPNALREALAQHGIPALVTVGTFCRSTPTVSSGMGKVLQPSSQVDGMVIFGQAIPPGTKLSIGYFPHAVKVGLIQDGARLSCGNPYNQPAVHRIPTGTPIREP